MKQREASAVWNELRRRNLNVTARFMEKGPLGGQHVVEIEPGPALVNGDIGEIVQLAKDRQLELSYGQSPRRVLVLS